MANELATKPHDVFALIDSKKFKEELARALPNALDPNRMVRLALTMVRKNSTLAKCSPVSIMACVVECAQLGLEPEGVLGHAYLVPFKGEATLIIGYRGFAHLMYQSGTISSISAEVVRRGDTFQQTLGSNRELIHIPGEIPKNDGPENWRGAYAVAEFITGKTAFEYLDSSKIEAARNRSSSWHSFKKDGRSTPWQTDAEEMWRKTPVRRLAKRMPTSTADKRPQILRAAMLDEYSERKGLLVPTLGGFEVNPNPPEPDDPNPITPTQELIVDHPPEQATFAEADDPFISEAQQREVYAIAVGAGWKLPSEMKAYLKKKWKVDSLRLIRRSQLPAILKQVQEGT